MKKHLSILLFGVAAISFTGCYTRDCSLYQEPVIIYYPVPEPVYLPEEPYYPPPTNPAEPEYKTRPITRPHTGDIRRPGIIRNPVTPPKRDDFRNPGKIRVPVTPPPIKDRIKEDNRNPGGKNQDGRISRR